MADMKVLTLVCGLVLFACIDAKAQLVVDENDHVMIESTTSTNSPLRIGPNYFGGDSYSNIAVSSSPKNVYNSYYVGVEGCVKTSSNVDILTKCGIRGVVSPYSESTNGRHYGVAGIHSGLGDSGGAGILGSSTFSTYNSGPTITGVYAGYFVGNIRVVGDLTASEVTSTSDLRMKDNIVLFEEVEDGQTTLDKVMDMMVLEYNLKDTGDYDVPNDIRQRLQIEHPEVLMELEKRKAESASLRHYGLSAQELLGLYPNVVNEGQDGYLSVNYIEMIPILVRCLQELKHQTDEVKAVKMGFSNGTAVFEDN